jgi:Reverse transcriptase (RNA-dependent DNA polymerase)
MERDDSNKWRDAIIDEWESLIKLDTFADMDKLPAGRSAISCKWVFKTKISSANDPRYKARLVVRGFEQKYGIDYTETFAPVAKLATIRLLFSLTASGRWFMHQMDVKTAFLNPTISEDIYIELPEGYEWLFKRSSSLSRPAKYLKLNKALYGLKQALREWY